MMIHETNTNTYKSTIYHSLLYELYEFRWQKRFGWWPLALKPPNETRTREIDLEVQIYPKYIFYVIGSHKPYGVEAG